MQLVAFSCAFLSTSHCVDISPILIVFTPPFYRHFTHRKPVVHYVCSPKPVRDRVFTVVYRCKIKMLTNKMQITVRQVLTLSFFEGVARLPSGCPTCPTICALIKGRVCSLSAPSHDYGSSAQHPHLHVDDAASRKSRFNCGSRVCSSYALPPAGFV